MGVLLLWSECTVTPRNLPAGQPDPTRRPAVVGGHKTVSKFTSAAFDLLDVFRSFLFQFPVVFCLAEREPLVFVSKPLCILQSRADSVSSSAEHVVMDSY